VKGVKAALIVVLAATTSAYADTAVRATIDGGGHPIKLVTTWAEHGKLELDGKLVYAGDAAGTVVAGHGLVVVAYEVAGDSKPFRLRISDDGKLGEPLSFARPGKAANSPFAIAATATPDGFAIFYQEVQNNDPTAAHTYMLELDGDGKPGTPKEIQVPWALADVVWNGNGYHLALIYAGGGDGMRLSMVSASKEGQPQGHPDWASAPGIVMDVHLVKVGDRILAYYRGGAGGDRLIETDVTHIGGWGSVTEHSTDRGALAQTTTLAVNAKGDAVRLK
jgi:hypothetical protein